ncbi:glycosyltransferase [Clostridium algidicarnis]|uniref:Glycosyltransferase n=1 Tax=Clostridium algidicarnis TaxID=37659 RepID=A0ABS6C5G6_9CLOT|nr:glycosyltransferase [Clostridium algidicarnis]MBU3220657.1 glycosyltransferase [Clostridium algidicarnis]
MKEKVCHITSAHDRNDVRIFMKECVSIAKNGYDVSLIVNDIYPDELNKGVKIISTNFKPKNRIERFIKSKKMIYRKALEVNADIYHLHDPDLLPIGNKLKKKNKKVIFDSHEDVPKQILDKTWIPKNLRRCISDMYSFYEKRTLKKYDAIISVTPHIVERLLKINANTVLVTNYPILGELIDLNRKSSNSICFAGGITSQYNHDKIIKAIEEIDDIEYIMAGGGTKEYLSSLQSLPGWGKVNYVGTVSHEEVKDIYSKSIAGLALDYSTQGKEHGTLGIIKMFEYMEAGIPIICSDYELWKRLVDKEDCGICINPNSIEDIRKAINYIMTNQDKARLMGENGKRASVDKYNWGTQEKILLDLYRSL